VSVALIGGGPAGLMAAEVISAAGLGVDLYDGMPSVGRKFLLAGKGGLNLTHSEPFEPFVERYADAAAWLRPLLQQFGAEQARELAAGLGISTFVGTSGRVFPTDMKAAPLLRAWLHRLRGRGVRLHMRHRWQGWDDAGALVFDTPQGRQAVKADATVLALGGASWQRLGSDGAWVPLLAARGVDVAPLQPSNCGFDVGLERAPAQPARRGAAEVGGHRLDAARRHAAAAAGRIRRHRHRRGRQPGLCRVGGLREAIARDGSATFHIDLLPARDAAWVAAELAHPRGHRSLATHLKTRLKLDGVKAALLWEGVDRRVMDDPARWRHASRRCRSRAAPRAPSTRPSAPPAACAATRWTTA
jgi:uncharacterized flavoprotein (TIGR03862 family)